MFLRGANIRGWLVPIAYEHYIRDIILAAHPKRCHRRHYIACALSCKYPHPNKSDIGFLVRCKTLPDELHAGL